MFRNILQKFFILQLFIISIYIGCSRENPESITNPTSIQKIYPINVYALTIPEPSGVAYNSKNNSLMVVSDGNPDIFEIDFTGITLNTIIASGSDMEGITLSKNCDTIYVVEEKKKLVTTFDLNGKKLNSFSINVATSDNNALEGITINTTSNQLFIINEKNPRMIIGYSNLTEFWRKSIDYALDISDIYFEDSTNCFWLISDESQKIMKLSSTGDLLKEWEIPFTKGEGITIVGDKIYVVNDLDGKLYVFQKPI
ncbi:MAG TPA: SdiA-regulated domain-containing protein [Ignavibacteriaceae bacterium]